MVVPGGEALLRAEFVRDGADLLIEASDGTVTLVEGYFAGDTPPDIVTGGAVVPGRIAARLARPAESGEGAAGDDVLIGGNEEDLLGAADAPADQQEAALTPQDTAGAQIAEIAETEGEVVILRADGTRVVAEPGTVLYEDDVVTTGEGGSAGIVFIDGMSFSLGEKGRLLLDEFEYQPEAHEGGGLLSVLQGQFSFVSGEAAHTAEDALMIETPTMTIGVRGTKVVAQAAAEGEVSRIALLAEEDGTVGKIMVTTDEGSQLVSEANMMVEVVSRFQAPSAQLQISTDQVHSFFNSALSVLPAPAEFFHPDAPETGGPEAGPGGFARPGEAADSGRAGQEAPGEAGGESAAGDPLATAAGTGAPVTLSAVASPASSSSAPVAVDQPAVTAAPVALAPTGVAAPAPTSSATPAPASAPAPAPEAPPASDSVPQQPAADTAAPAGPVSTAPAVVSALADRNTDEDGALVLDTSTAFADPDDAMTFSAVQAGGAPLPGWLTFDPTTGVLSGTPGNDDVGSLDLEVTATDGAGQSASSGFRLTVDNVNDAPTVTGTFSSSVLGEETAFNYDVSGKFADVDGIHGDSLTFSAEQVGGAPLPGWLSIDPSTGVLSGTPGNGDVGFLNVKVIATDDLGAAAFGSFQVFVSNVNDAPTLASAIADAPATEDSPLSYDVSGSFADVDSIHGDTLTFSATLSGGAALPSWLSIDPSTGVLSGTPTNDDVGTLDVEVTATDILGANAADTFQLTVGNVNDAPTLTGAIADAPATEDTGFSYDISGKFADVDAIHGDSLTYSAKLSGGTALPAWLSIDSSTGVLSGTPANGDVGALDVEVTAIDQSGASASDTFQLTVANTNDAPVLVSAIPDAEPMLGQFFSADVSSYFADADTLHGDSLTFSAEISGGLPLLSWLSIDPSTGVISGAPSALDLGSPVQIEVTATDSQGASVVDTFQLTVDNDNDAPVLSIVGDPALTSIAEDTVSPAGNTVADIVIDGSITDPDGGAVEAIAVTSVDDTNGTWQYSTDGGASFTAIGAVSETSALLLDAAAVVRFVPDADYSGTASFGFKAWDKSAGTNGDSGVDTTSGTAFSAASESASIQVVATGDLLPDFASGSEVQVNTTTAGDQGSPAVAALSGGGHVIVWDSDGQDGDKTGVFAQRYDAEGNTVGGEFQVNTTTANEQENPTTVGLEDGGFVVVWQSQAQDGANWGIFGQRFDASGTAVGTEFQVNTATANDQANPEIAALAGGGFVVTWDSQNQDGSNTGVFAQRYDAAGNPAGAEFQVNTETTSQQETAQVAALTGGGFVVTWQSQAQDGGSWGVYAQRYDASGNAAGSEFQVNSWSSNQQQGPAVTALEDGGFVIAWQSQNQDGDGWGVFGQRFDASGNPIEFEFQVNSTVADGQSAPSVSALNDGGFLVAWQSDNQDGSGTGLFAQRFNADGDALGAEFQINTTTANNEQGIDLATLSDSSVVAAWESDAQDGSGSGVFAHHYDSDVAPATDNAPLASGDSVLDLGGSNGFVEVADTGAQHDLQAHDLTVEAWFYYDGAAAGDQMIVSKGNETGDDQGYSIFLNNGELVVRVNATDGSADADTAAASIAMPGTAGWYHVAMVVDQEAGAGASSVTGYLNGSGTGWTAGYDGVANDSFTTASGGTDTDHSLMMGAVDTGSGQGSYFANGQLADVRLWNTARSEAEIQADMARTLDGDEPHLVANWRLDDGLGSIAVDSVTGGVDGSLASGAGFQDSDSFSIAMDGALAGRITATDAEGDTLSFSVSTGATHGIATIDAQSGAWEYTPDNGYTGNDGFSYQIADGNGGTDEVTISVVVS